MSLCTLDQLKAYLPSFTAEVSTDEDGLLQRLIDSESDDFLAKCGREVVAMNDDTVRTFDLTVSMIARRSLPIGDAADVTQLELFDYDGTTSLGVISTGLYVLQPRVRESWRPISRIWFPYRPVSAPVLLAPGRSVQITATWGWPAVPARVQEAVVALAAAAYLSDAGRAQDVENVDPELAAAFRRNVRKALDVRDGLSLPGFA
jgi:hypothetical protein